MDNGPGRQGKSRAGYSMGSVSGALATDIHHKGAEAAIQDLPLEYRYPQSSRTIRGAECNPEDMKEPIIRLRGQRDESCVPGYRSET